MIEGITLVDYSKSYSSPNRYYPDAFGSQARFSGWTGTTTVIGSDFASSINLYGGNLGSTEKEDPDPVRCVRGH